MPLKRFSLLLIISLIPVNIISACSNQAVASPTPVNAQAASSPFNIFLLDRDKYPDAICNDGSPGAFVFRRGEGEGADKWLLILQGGGACNSLDSCSDRHPSLLSSIPWRIAPKQTISAELNGILSTSQVKNPHFYNWNQVFFFYCSSDTWKGQRLASSDPEGINWAGHFIMAAILDTLQDPAVISSPNLSAAKDILFAGSSAGAAGVINSVDWVAERLRSDGIDAEFRGILDAGVGPLDNPDETFAEPGSGWLVWQPFIDADCAAAHAAAGDPWRCTSSEYLLANNFITTPLFVYHDQNDPATKRNYLGDDFQARIQEILGALPNSFSPDIGIHFILTNTRFMEVSSIFPTEFIAGYENSLYLEEGVSYTFSDLLWLWYSHEIK